MEGSTLVIQVRWTIWDMIWMALFGEAVWGEKKSRARALKGQLERGTLRGFGCSMRECKGSLLLLLCWPVQRYFQTAEDGRLAFPYMLYTFLPRDARLSGTGGGENRQGGAGGNR